MYRNFSGFIEISVDYNACYHEVDVIRKFLAGCIFVGTVQISFYSTNCIKLFQIRNKEKS